MRPVPTRWPRRTVLLAIPVLGVLALPPTVALALDGAPPPVDHPQRAEGAAGAATPAGLCEAELTTFTREGVSGQAHAVALTAQAIDRDTDGWLLLSWQAADGTQLTDVLATATDGTTRHLDPTPTGTVDHVTALTFCGTHTTAATVTDPADLSDAVASAGPTAGEGAGDAAPDPATPASLTADTDLGGADPEQAADGERRADGGPDDDDGSRDDGPRTTDSDSNTGSDGDAPDDDLLGRGTGDEEPVAGDIGDIGPDGDDGDDGDDGEDGEVEVMGVRIVSPPAAARASADPQLGKASGTAGEEPRTLALAGSGRPVTGWPAWLLLAAVGAGLAAVGTWLRIRTQAATATNASSTPDGPEAGR